MTNLKRFLFASFFVLMIVSGVSYAADYPGPVGFVNDFANVFSADQKNNLTEKIRNFEKETSAEIAVVTVISLEGQDVKTYANKLFNKWGIGKKGKSNGILLLLAVKDRKVRIETGYGNEGALNDAKAGRVIREVMVPFLKQNKFAEGLMAGTEEVMVIIKSEASTGANKSQTDKSVAPQVAAAAIVAPASNAGAIGTGTFYVIAAVIALLGVLACIGIIIGLIKRSREKLHSLRNGTENKINAFFEIETEYASVSRGVNALNSCSPRPILKYSLNEKDDVERFLGTVKSNLTSFSDLLRKRKLASDDLFDSSESLRKDVLAAKSRVHTLASELHLYNRNKEAAQKFIEYLPGAIKKADEEVDHADVPESFKRELARAKSSLSDISEITKKESIDWTQVHGTLESAKDDVDSITQKAISEKKRVATARSKSMEMVSSLSGIIQETELEINHADVDLGRAKELVIAKKIYERGKIAYHERNWTAAFEALSNASDALRLIRSNAESDKAQAEKARKEGPKLLAAFPGLIQGMEVQLKNFDARFTERSKKMLDDARKKYAEAETLRSKNWLAAFTLLTAGGILLTSALSEAQNHKEADEERSANKRREEERKKKKREEEREEREEEERRSRRNRDGGSSFGFGGTSSGSSGWSGGGGGDSFGGGSSGGGGADGGF